jgi:pimeloyl-ACP methyl ester carboxylesterase
MSSVTTLSRSQGSGLAPIVIAIRCSGSLGASWRSLTNQAASDVALNSPGLLHYDIGQRRTGGRPLSLSDEAAPIVDLIDGCDGPVHLVGHCYGGAVALRAARQRPHRLASLALYEPWALHVLKTIGHGGRSALAEIRALARDAQRAARDGFSIHGAQKLVDYWHGLGAWFRMGADRRSAIGRFIPEACLELGAAAAETTPLAAYRRFGFPVLLLQREAAREPVRLIAYQLVRAISGAVVQTVPDDGRSGPFADADSLLAMLVAHVRRERHESNAVEQPATPPGLPAVSRRGAMFFRQSRPDLRACSPRAVCSGIRLLTAPAPR